VTKFENCWGIHTEEWITYQFLNLVILPMDMKQTECSETSAYKIQAPGNYPEENIQEILSAQSYPDRFWGPLVLSFNWLFTGTVESWSWPHISNYTDVKKAWSHPSTSHLPCLFIQLRNAALRLIARSWLDVPNFATRRLHALHHARAPSGGRWNCGREMSDNFA
jgi:hypothetical protein